MTFCLKDKTKIIEKKVVIKHVNSDILWTFLETNTGAFRRPIIY